MTCCFATVLTQPLVTGNASRYLAAFSSNAVRHAVLPLLAENDSPRAGPILRPHAFSTRAVHTIRGSHSRCLHFREVVRLAPKSQLGQLSRSWLTVLGTPSPTSENKVSWETTNWLVDLLHRDKTIEELAKQLNALKRVDLEMKARAPHHIRPRLDDAPNSDKVPLSDALK